jgi:hypothetical protein
LARSASSLSIGLLVAIQARNRTAEPAVMASTKPFDSSVLDSLPSATNASGKIS